jgi:hypothetical protein
MSFLVRAFHLAYACLYKTFAKRCIHTGTWPRLLEVDSSDKLISTHNKRFRIGEQSSFDGGLRPFGVAHAIGRREVKVVGDHHSAKILREGPRDGRHVWVKLCTPTGLNLLKNPCPQ